MELVRWGGRHRLVGRADPEEIIGVHISDSLAWLRVLTRSAPGELAGQVVVDVGTGAGFPGLVACCAAPALTVVLNEPAPKRTAFLYGILHSLSVPCEVVEQPVEALLQEGRRFDHAVSRAFRAPDSWLVVGRRLVRSSGTVWVLATEQQKGPKGRVDFEYRYRLGDGRRRRILGLVGGREE